MDSLPASVAMYVDSLMARVGDTRSGSQVYDVTEPLSPADSVGQPLHHRWAAQCSTGEAVFIDDMQPAAGTAYLFIYLIITAKKSKAVTGTPEYGAVIEVM